MRKKIRIVSCIMVLALFAVLGTVYYTSNASSGNGKYTFYSDFSMFNIRSLRMAEWERKAARETEFTSRFKPDNVKFTDKKLVLTVDKDENGLTAGQVFTDSSYGFGLYQVSMKPIKNSGVVSAFFNYYQEGNTGTEIDIEFLGYDTTIVQFNYYTDGIGGHEYIYDLGFDASEEFHTYSFYWGSDKIIWYVDGQQAYEANTSIPQHEAKIHMDVCAGDNPEWVGAYDGAHPLNGYYDWISYTSIEDMN